MDDLPSTGGHLELSAVSADDTNVSPVRRSTIGRSLILAQIQTCLMYHQHNVFSLRPRLVMFFINLNSSRQLYWSCSALMDLCLVLAAVVAAQVRLIVRLIGRLKLVRIAVIIAQTMVTAPHVRHLARRPRL